MTLIFSKLYHCVDPRIARSDPGIADRSESVRDFDNLVVLVRSSISTFLRSVWAQPSWSGDHNLTLSENWFVSPLCRSSCSRQFLEHPSCAKATWWNSLDQLVTGLWLSKLQSKSIWNRWNSFCQIILSRSRVWRWVSNLIPKKPKSSNLEKRLWSSCLKSKTTPTHQFSVL